MWQGGRDAVYARVMSDAQLGAGFPDMPESAPRDDPYGPCLRPCALHPEGSDESQYLRAGRVGGGEEEEAVEGGGQAERQVLLAVSLRRIEEGDEGEGEGAGVGGVVPDLVVGSMHACCDVTAAVRQKRQCVRAITALVDIARAVPSANGPPTRVYLVSDLDSMYACMACTHRASGCSLRRCVAYSASRRASHCRSVSALR